MIKIFNFSRLRKKIYFVLFVLILMSILFFLSQKSSSNLTDMSGSFDFVCYACLDHLIPFSHLGKQNSLSFSKNSILNLELPILYESCYEEKVLSVNNTISSSDHSNTEISKEIISSDTSATAETYVSPSYTNEYNGVLVQNSSNYDLTYEILDPTGLEISTQNILIFHTHTCESYTPTEQNSYEESGNFRTTDLEYSVAKVGNVLKDHLETYGFNVIHDTTYHDYPSYNGSYGRSLSTVQAILSSYPNTDIIIDLHRDAISDSSYAPSVTINGERVSQLMFVLGTDGSGLNHPNWQSNLKFAVKVQEKANELYPGLFKPIILRNSRYNHHLGKAACIIEVGATGNTLEQSMASMKYLATVLKEILN